MAGKTRSSEPTLVKFYLSLVSDFEQHGLKVEPSFSEFRVVKINALQSDRAIFTCSTVGELNAYLHGLKGVK